MFNLFTHSFTLKWWQGALYEIAVVSAGILVGSHFPEFWLNYANILWVTFIIPGVYIFYIYFSQK